MPAHPMAGLPDGGIEHAHADLFENRPWFVCPEGADDDAVKTVELWVEGAGARAVRLTAGEHDAAIAALDAEPDSGERRAGFDTRLNECLHRSEARCQALFFSRLHGNDLDFRVERLAQRRQNGKPAQPGGMRGERSGVLTVNKAKSDQAFFVGQRRRDSLWATALIGTATLAVERQFGILVEQIVDVRDELALGGHLQAHDVRLPGLHAAARYEGPLRDDPGDGGADPQLVVALHAAPDRLDLDLRVAPDDLG